MQRAKITEAHSVLDSFKVVLRGGRWTHAHSGRAYDAVAAQANLSTSKEFCRLYQLPVMQSFATQRYGDNLASTLAGVWAHKMTHLFTYWQDSLGAEVKPYPDQSVVAYVEDPAVPQLLQELPAGSQAAVRIEQIRQMWPALRKD